MAKGISQETEAHALESLPIHKSCHDLNFWGFPLEIETAPAVSTVEFPVPFPHFTEKQTDQARKGLALALKGLLWLLRADLLIAHLVEQNLLSLQHPQMIPKI